MTRAAEFCYIAETQPINPTESQFVVALQRHGPILSSDPEMALRITADGRAGIAREVGMPIGFRKILAG